MKRNPLISKNEKYFEKSKMDKKNVQIWKVKILLPQFREKNPDYKNYTSKTSDKYDKMVLEAMGGAGDNDLEKEDNNT